MRTLPLAEDSVLRDCPLAFFPLSRRTIQRAWLLTRHTMQFLLITTEKKYLDQGRVDKPSLEQAVSEAALVQIDR